MNNINSVMKKIQNVQPANKHVWVNFGSLGRLKPQFTFVRGHPAGYTDDLCIIADKNQWVDRQPSGWRSQVDPEDYLAMREWCETNLKGPWYTGIYYVFIESEKDVAWFMLRWS